jgi:thymidylate synthase
MNNLDRDYQALLQDILDNGVKKQDRTGTGTISVFGRQIRHDMKTGFPLLTTKRIKFKTIVTELLWFLLGDTNIKYLVDNGCNIWNGDAYKNYEKQCVPGTGKKMSQEEFINFIKTNDEFANKFGELGPIYGKQWRSWEGHKHGMVLGAGLSKEQPIDQIQNLINDLKTNPDSRRLMVNAWNVGELDQMVLPPCHYGFQVYTRELSLEERFNIWKPGGRFEIFQEQYPGTHSRNNPNDLLDAFNIPTRAISLMWNQRSVDTFLGLPFNIASYGLLLEILAKEVNMVPDELIGNLGDVHLYSNHVEQAKEQIGRERTHEEMVMIYNQLKNKKDVDDLWTWESRFKDNNITKRTREPHPLPKLVLNPIFLANLEHKGLDEAINGQVNFQLENYQSHPHIPAPLSN